MLRPCAWSRPEALHHPNISRWPPPDLMRTECATLRRAGGPAAKDQAGRSPPDSVVRESAAEEMAVPCCRYHLTSRLLALSSRPRASAGSRRSAESLMLRALAGSLRRDVLGSC